MVFLLFSVFVAVSLFLSRRYMREFRETAINDPLTGLYTRGYLDEVGPRMLSRSRQDGGADLTAVFFDIDRFKRVNDTYGHRTGDVVLREIGGCLREHLRPNEMAFRYGGEELVVLIPAGESAGRSVAERIRAAVGARTFDGGGRTFSVTVSAGVATAQPGEPIGDLLRRADRCLYAAKERGRDRTVTATELAESPPAG